jgi:hypothetical protein
MAGLPEPTRGRVLEQDYAKYGFPLRTGPPYIPLALVSDPWDYLDYYLRDKLGVGATKRPRAFLEQARDFFDAAESHRVSSRPLLYYYAFLNLVKALLLARGHALEEELLHGLKRVAAAPAGGKRFRALRVRVLKSTSGREVFPNFVTALGGSVGKGREFRLVDLLQQCVGIHSTWVEVTSSRGCFALAQIEPRVRSDRAAVYALAIMEEPWDDPALPEAIRQRAGWRQVKAPSEYRVVGLGHSGLVFLETRPVARTGRGYRTALTEVARDIRRVGVHALLTRQGYRLYLSHFGAAENARIPQLASIYAAMFYLGDITRYQPQDFDTMISGQWAWLVNDFLNSQPKQFLYLLASELTESDVVIPFGQVD